MSEMGMDSKKIQEELQFLLEEDNRVITYKFVSANFGIHVNDAKRHMQSLLGVCRGKGDDDVTATFYLSGVCDEQGDYTSQKSLVVAEDQLAAARGSLTSVTSEHVFSLQRHRVCETTVLYGADQQERQGDPAAYNSHGAITNPGAERIPEAELLKARQAALPPVAQPPRRPAAPASAVAVVKKEIAAEGSEKPSGANPKSSRTDGQDTSAEGEKSKSGKSSAATKQGATIASMFAKAGTEKKTKSPPKKPAGGGMMANFLQKGAERKPSASGGDASSAAPAAAPAAPAAAPAAAAASDQSDSSPVKTESVSPPVKTKSEKGMETVVFGAKKSTTTTTTGGKAGKRAAARGKRTRKGDASAAPARQRRRIQVLASDSDSSDEEVGREEPEPEPEPLPPPPESDDEELQQPATQQQNTRKRKLVTKTFVDDEGFMVTKKEYESCSGSESEEPPAKKNAAAANEKSSAAPAPAPAPAHTESAKSSKPKEAVQHKAKQPGIMSFFKKK